MPLKDPANRKYRIALYVLYGVLIAWLLISFGVGAARGVFTTAGKDLLAARQAALLVCGAALASDPEQEIAYCPPDAPTGAPTALLRKAREATSGISDAALKTKIDGSINAFEVIASGKLHRSNIQRLVSEPLKDYLN